jgi:hypothetical protein
MRNFPSQAVARTIAPFVFMLAACSDAPTGPAPAPPPVPAAPEAALGGWIERLFGSSAGAADPRVLVGAGDIARCYQPDDPRSITPPRQTAAEATAKLLDRIPGTVMAIGDNAYEAGSLLDYALCYHPTWGRHRWRTKPAVGNHEYITPGAAGYFAYFGARAAPPLGYYSYDQGGWHVVVLNSMTQWSLCPPPRTSTTDGRLCAGDAAQRMWLARDLAEHPSRCTVAYFHHPRFSSGNHGSQYEMTQFWDILYANGVDVVISAHDHHYERFAPQDPDGNPTASGIRQFLVGTGGAELYGLRAPIANSEVRDNSTHGVLVLRLGDGNYAWEFVPVDGGTFTDAGSADCH